MGRAVSQGLPLSHSERGKAHTPSSPPLRVIAMTDRRIPRDCCPLPAVIRMCQTVSPDLPCYSTPQVNEYRRVQANKFKPMRSETPKTSLRSFMIEESD
ncbi:UNVERIFIED_CONTAM: hypothetical protein FKN15_051944 [Acipenser sinensis]